ncbi:MAG: prepilin-type N-terminal cleavage/methylation domain-containing protein [Planctomycetes bacterium]|nr:prepilin-type N-terminal cleavage/methylation domain-containing protein [Planctomycetota bacterium]
MSIQRQQTGFTLVELLLAMTLTSILTIGLHDALQHAFAVWKRIETSRPICTQSNMLFDRLRTELAGAYVSKPSEIETPAPQPQDPNSDGHFTFRAVSQDSTDCLLVLEFFSVTPSWNQPLSLARPCRIRYEGWRHAQTSLCELIRTEQLYSGNQAIGPESTQTILTGFTRVKTSAATLSEMGTAAWNRQFESQEALPNAIKVELTWPRDTPEDTVSMEMMYVVQQASTLVPRSDASGQEADNEL